MEKRRDGKVTALVALFIGVIGLSIGFASLSTALSINGSATVESSNWDIHFANLQNFAKTGTAAQVTAPTIKGEGSTVIGDYSVTLQTPKDSISYTFDIVNGGDYAAKISTITVPTPQCTGTGTSATTDADNVCKYLTYTLKYTDTNADVKANDELAAGATKTVKLTLTYDAAGAVTSSELPAGDVSISNLQIPITYVQK